MPLNQLEFTWFLQEHGIFNKNQANNFNSNTMYTFDQTQAVHKLADFFKMLTPSECYDIALRLYLKWKQKKPLPNNKIKAANNMIEIIENLIKRRKLIGIIFIQTYASKSIKKSQIEFLAQESIEAHKERENDLGRRSSTTQTSDSKSNNNDVLQRTIHNRLYSEANIKLAVYLQNEDRKAKEQIKDCTFQPEIKKNDQQHNQQQQSNGNNEENVFERLQKNIKKENEEANQAKKIQQEMQDCTFHPNISSSPKRRNVSPHTNNSNSIRSPSFDNIFSRLFNESTLKKQIQLDYEKIKQQYELEKCTFQPQVNLNRANSIDDPNIINKKIDMLYNEFFEKQKNLMKMKLEHDQNELQGCTFKPQILSKEKKDEKVDPQQTAKRLLDWEKEKQKKIEEMKKLRDQEIQQFHIENNNKCGNDSGEAGEAIFDKLYKQNSQKVQNMKELEAKVLKEIGATFTPKTNKSRCNSFSPNKSIDKILKIAEKKIKADLEQDKINRKQSTAELKLSSNCKVTSPKNAVLRGLVSPPCNKEIWPNPGYFLTKEEKNEYFSPNQAASAGDFKDADSSNSIIKTPDKTYCGVTPECDKISTSISNRFPSPGVSIDNSHSKHQQSFNIYAKRLSEVCLSSAKKSIRNGNQAKNSKEPDQNIGYGMKNSSIASRIQLASNSNEKISRGNLQNNDIQQRVWSPNQGDYYTKNSGIKKNNRV